MSKTVHLILASTRQNRIGEEISQWIKRQVENKSSLKLEIIDLAQENLPFFNAPVSPAYAADDSPHAIYWAKKIADTERIIFLTPEYNRSIPASLKNAIDYLVAEWKNKPMSVVSYGYVDGGQSATKHLLDITAWLKMKQVGEPLNIPLTQDLFKPDGSGLKDIDTDFNEHESQLMGLIDKLVE